MWVEESGWIATGVGAPVVAVFLLWAALVLHCDRRKWRLLDPLLMALLMESVLQQTGTCLSTVVLLFHPDDELWCSLVVWWLAAVRVFQASTLTTLAVARLVRVRYSHIIYHLVCLSIISACIGVAAVLARSSPCEDTPDRRYIVFSLFLHLMFVFVTCVGVVCCCCKSRASTGADTFINGSRHCRRQLLNSSSDLSSAISDVSMLSTIQSRVAKRVSHSVSDCSARRIRHSLVEELLRISPVSSGPNPPVIFLNGGPDKSRLAASNLFINGKHPWNTCSHCTTCENTPDLQVPCSAMVEESKLMGCELETHRHSEPCYISTSTTSASSTNSRSPCLSTDRPQEVSLTVVLSLVFLCYAINHIPVLALTSVESFLPQLIPPHWPVSSIPLWAGLLEGILLPVVLAMTDKAFVRRVAIIYSHRRPFDMTKPPQGLHGKFRPFNNSAEENQRPLETVRFPITNGSLFTSLDGRIPIIHNYRRSRGVRTTGLLPSYCVNHGMGDKYCSQYVTPEEDCSSQKRTNILIADINCDHKFESSLSHFGEVQKSKESTQCYTQCLRTSDLRKDTPPFPQNIQQLRESLFMTNQDSEDDYEDFDEACEEPIYATLSSHSACSATTVANDDFEFYQQEGSKENYETDLRSSSLRSPPIQRKPSRSSSIDKVLKVQEVDEEEKYEQGCPRPKYRQRPLSHRLELPPTPHPPRRLAPVLSVDSLVAALHQADISYLDNGELYHHHSHSSSVPDLKKVFYTGFL